MGNNKKESLDKLKKLEEEKAKSFEEQKNQEVEETEEDKSNHYDVIDGFRKLEKSSMPFEGKFYPASWEFYYRSPTTKEVANFSTIDEQNQPAIVKAVTSLIKKCFVIVDTEKNKEVSSEQINDGERLFFFLKIREYYLNDKPISYNVINEEAGGVITVDFVADSLIFPEVKPQLLERFDGRTFTFDYKGAVDGDQIKFLIPTLKTTTRILNYIETIHKKVQDRGQNKLKKGDFNKQLLVFAPFLYEHGNESMEILRKKFSDLQKNEAKFKALNTIINKFNLTNTETIKYYVNGSQEETLMKFPGGWKNMFVDDTEFDNLF